MPGGKSGSRKICVPCAVSSFFEICDRHPDGSAIKDKLKVGARGGGFVIEAGSKTAAFRKDDLESDTVAINEKVAPSARTTLRTIELIRKDHGVPFCAISHEISPPIGTGFGTSGSGALGTAIAVSDLFGLNLTLIQASSYAHIAEIESVTGLGTVISLASGSGAIGIVTEPGTFSTGKVDALLFDHQDYTLICGCFGPVAKSYVLQHEAKRKLVNRYGDETLLSVLDERTPEALLRHSKIFAEKTGLASPELLKIAVRAVEFGAVGATQNMIGDAVHCLVERKKRKSFLEKFSGIIKPRGIIFESSLSQSGPYFERIQSHT